MVGEKRDCPDADPMGSPRAYSPRWGRFRVSGMWYSALRGDDAGLQSNHAESLMALFGQMIIVRAHDCPYGDGVDYWAVSLLFDEVPEGEPVPWYELEWQTIDHGEDFAEKGHVHRCEGVAKAFKRKPPSECW